MAAIQCRLARLEQSMADGRSVCEMSDTELLRACGFAPGYRPTGDELRRRIAAAEDDLAACIAAREGGVGRPTRRATPTLASTFKL